MATMMAGAIAAGTIVTGGAPAVAVTTETRQFTGWGSSFGSIFAHFYAYADALRQATEAGFDSSTCTEVSSDVGIIEAWVTVECTR